ncbi:hypothetical protein ACLEBY_00715 [Klebsiella pneumoniae]|uniref:hypothetical protein n=1 Tax=Klebsiella pneumoniae TaxID=573 RepID=UPI003976A74C
MVNVKNISLDKKAFKKNNTATTNFDGPGLCASNLRRHLTLITLKLIELLTALWQKLLAAILTGARILTAEAM